jgi:hypothetical protein
MDKWVATNGTLPAGGRREDRVIRCDVVRSSREG